VNLVSKTQKEMFEYFGTHSGRDVDKLPKMNTALAEGIKVNVPLLEESPINIECKVVQSFMKGSHEMFIATVEHVHSDQTLVDAEGKINHEGIDFL